MKREHIILLFIFLFSLLFRLHFVFQTQSFSSDEAYFHLRHVEYITENFKPLIYDPLSYGGRYIVNAHLFHYFLAAFNFFIPESFTFKVIPAIVMSLVTLAVFYIAKRITENNSAALFAAFMSAFVPVGITQTINQVSTYPLTLIITFYMIYCLLGITEKVYPFVILSFILPLLDPLSFLFAVALVFYAMLLYLDSIQMSKLRKEAVTFSIFLIILINFLVFKKAFVSFGFGAIWQNIPPELLTSYFKDVNILETMYSIGIIPLLLGIFGFAFGLFKEKKQLVYLISGFILADILLLILRLINFNTGMLLLGLLMTIMSALALDKIEAYFSITKFTKYKRVMALLLFAMIIITLVVPSYFSAKKIINEAFKPDEIEAMDWLKENTPEEAVILADISEGHLISAIAQRKNVADENFLLAKKRYSNVINMFKTESLVQAMETLRMYGVDYIYLSKRTKEKYNKEELVYLRDENCFERVYQNEEAQIYSILC